MSWFKNPASCHFIMLSEINDAVLQYGAWIMFSIHMPQKFTSKRFPSDSAKQCKLCLAEYAVKNSCSSEYPNCWSYWNRMRFILANLQIVIWFEAGIVRHSCVCVWGQTELGSWEESAGWVIIGFTVQRRQNEQLMKSAVVQLQRHRGEGLCTVKLRQAKLCCNLYYKQSWS